MNDTPNPEDDRAVPGKAPEPASSQFSGGNDELPSEEQGESEASPTESGVPVSTEEAPDSGPFPSSGPAGENRGGRREDQTARSTSSSSARASTGGDEDKDKDKDVVPPNNLTTEKVAEFRNDVSFIIGLIGYPGAGKTFFLNRLKYTYAGRKDDLGRRFTAEPSFVDVPISQTTFPTYHKFYRATIEDFEVPAASPRNDFVIFDLPGEYLSRAMAAGMTGKLASDLYDAMSACDALVLLLPSDLLLGTDAPATGIVKAQWAHARSERAQLHDQVIPAQLERVEQSNTASNPELLDKFEEQEKLAALQDRETYLDSLIAELEAQRIDKSLLADFEKELAADRSQLKAFVHTLTKLASRVATQKRLGLSSAEFEGLPPSEQEEAQRKSALKSHTPPLYVAVSKGDDLLTEEAPIIPLHSRLGQIPRDALDEKLTLALYRCAPEIFDGIASTFRWFKFDMLTASRGQSVKRLNAKIQSTPMNTPVREGGVVALKLHYDEPNHGVLSVIRWLDFARAKSEENKRQLENRTRRIFGRLTSHPGREADLVARATVPGYGTKTFRGKALNACANFFLKASLRRVFWLGVALPALAVLVLGLYLSGIAGVTYQSWLGATGDYSFPPAARYAGEVGELQTNPLVRSGYLAKSVQPWSSIPAGGKMFAIPLTRAVRPTYAALLSDLQQLGDRSLTPEQASVFVDRLNDLQAETNREYAAAPGAVPDDRVRVRPIIPYHIGLVQLRAGQFVDAAKQFELAVELLDAIKAEGQLETGRLLGVKIATHYAWGIALLQSGDLARAKTQLDIARDMTPAPGERGRALLTPNGSAAFFTFDPERTPARMDTAALWSDSLAAYLRSFNPKIDLADGSALSMLVDQLSLKRAEIPQGHPLLANFVFAGALLGKPGDKIAMTSDLSAADPQLQAAMRWAYASLDLEVVARGEQPAITRAPADGIWGADQRIRHAISDGKPEAIDDVLAEWAPSGTKSEADSIFLRDLTNEIVAGQRAALPSGQRERLLSTYGKYLRGAGFVGRANDLSPVGAMWLGIVVSVLLWLWMLWGWGLFGRARRARAELFAAGHRADRLPGSQNA